MIKSKLQVLNVHIYIVHKNLHEELYIEVTNNHLKVLFSGVTSRGAAAWRSLSSSKMKQVKFETSMKNIPLGGNQEYYSME